MIVNSTTLPDAYVLIGSGVALSQKRNPTRAAVFFY